MTSSSDPSSSCRSCKLSLIIATHQLLQTSLTSSHCLTFLLRAAGQQQPTSSFQDLFSGVRQGQGQHGQGQGQGQQARPSAMPSHGHMPGQPVGSSHAHGRSHGSDHGSDHGSLDRNSVSNGEGMLPVKRPEVCAAAALLAICWPQHNCTHVR